MLLSGTEMSQMIQVVESKVEWQAIWRCIELRKSNILYEKLVWVVQTEWLDS